MRDIICDVVQQDELCIIDGHFAVLIDVSRFLLQVAETGISACHACGIGVERALCILEADNTVGVCIALDDRFGLDGRCFCCRDGCGRV